MLSFPRDREDATSTICNVFILSPRSRYDPPSDPVPARIRPGAIRCFSPSKEQSNDSRGVTEVKGGQHSDDWLSELERIMEECQDDWLSDLDGID